MKTLVEDEELKVLRAMADGSRKFEESGLREKSAAPGLKDIKALPARERFGETRIVSGDTRRTFLPRRPPRDSARGWSSGRGWTPEAS